MFIKKSKSIWSIIILIMMLILSSCSQAAPSDDDDEEEKSKIIGTWSSTGGDSYAISKDLFVYNDGGWGYDFAGIIVGHEDFTEKSGYITIKLTSVGSSSSKTAGKYYLMRWRFFNENSVQMSNAYKASGSEDKNTQIEAELEFTEANGYFSFYGDYIRK